MDIRSSDIANAVARDALSEVLQDLLGYESEAAFSRAYKRVVGVPPSALRRGEERQQRPAA